MTLHEQIFNPMLREKPIAEATAMPTGYNTHSSGAIRVSLPRMEYAHGPSGPFGRAIDILPGIIPAILIAG